MHPSQLLTELIEQAKSNGIKEGELAESAGLTPQGLSKAKARGDLRASTLDALGRQLGIELAWRPLKQRDDLVMRVRSGQLFRFGSKAIDD